MLQIISQSDEEKFIMYSKLTKKKLISMLIEANKHLQSRQLICTTKERVKTVGDICFCNPLNGGSGICGCVIGNNPIDNTQIPQYTISTNGLFNNQ